MKKEFKFTLMEQGIGIEYGDEKFLVSYDETSTNWDDAHEWCNGKGGKLPTVEQAMLLGENSDAINAALEEAGKEILGGWLRTDREHSGDTRFAWCVDMSHGAIYYDGKYHTSDVRAVSAFPVE